MNLLANGTNAAERRRRGKQRGDEQTRVCARENMTHRGILNIFKCRF